MDAKDLYVEQDENGLYGVKSFKRPVNKWIIEPQFTHIREFEYMPNPNFTIANKDGKAFLIDQEGDKVNGTEYDEIIYHDGIYYKMKSNGKWGYMDDKGEVKIIPQFDEAGSMVDNRAVVTINNNKYLIDNAGKKIAGPYKRIMPGDDNSLIFIVESTDGLKGFRGKDGTKISEVIFDSVDPFDNGAAYVEKDGVPGLINEKGVFLIDPKDKRYDEISWFQDGVARCRKANKWGLIDDQGTEIIKPQFDEIGIFEDGVAFALLERKKKLIGQKDKIYNDKKPEGPIKPKKSGDKYGYVDEKDEWIIKPIFDEANEFEGDVARIHIRWKWGLIDKQGNFIKEPQFTYINQFSDGLARAGFDRYWGYIDCTGEWMVEPQFRNAGQFYDGITAVRKHGGKYGFIDKKGNYVISPAFDNIITPDGWFVFEDGNIVLVCVEGKWGAINRQGEFIIEPIYDNASNFENGRAKLIKDTCELYIDAKGNIITEN